MTRLAWIVVGAYVAWALIVLGVTWSNDRTTDAKRRGEASDLEARRYAEETRRLRKQAEIDAEFQRIVAES